MQSAIRFIVLFLVYGAGIIAVSAFVNMDWRVIYIHEWEPGWRFFWVIGSAFSALVKIFAPLEREE